VASDRAQDQGVCTAPNLQLQQQQQQQQQQPWSIGRAVLFFSLNLTLENPEQAIALGSILFLYGYYGSAPMYLIALSFLCYIGLTYRHNSQEIRQEELVIKRAHQERLQHLRDFVRERQGQEQEEYERRLRQLREQRQLNFVRYFFNFLFSFFFGGSGTK